MKILTYSFLSSQSIRGVQKGYPLKLNIKKRNDIVLDFNQEFVVKLLPRLDWSVICAASELLELSEGFPKEINETVTSDTEILKKIHHLLLEVDIIEGELVCPETGRIFPIEDGVPNMLLNEDEV